MKTFKELRRSLGYPVFKEEEQRNLKSTIVLGEDVIVQLRSIVK